MIKAAIEKILSLGIREVKEVNGRTYTMGHEGLSAVKPPKSETLTVNTLTGIVDYNPLLAAPASAMIHVCDHKTVDVLEYDYTDAWLTRSTYMTAVHESPVFRFGQFMCAEEFIIQIQAMFVQDENTAAILRVVGNIKDDNVANFSDDGVTQSVTAKSGISTVATVPVPNPVTLRPFRTFMEIEQPASTFVFRMQKSGGGPTCALFEADGRMWRLEAIKSIEVWLAEKIPGIKIIA